MSTINNLIPSVQNADDVFGEQELEQELETQGGESTENVTDQDGSGNSGSDGSGQGDKDSEISTDATEGVEGNSEQETIPSTFFSAMAYSIEAYLAAIEAQQESALMNIDLYVDQVVQQQETTTSLATTVREKIQLEAKKMMTEAYVSFATAGISLVQAGASYKANSEYTKPIADVKMKRNNLQTNLNDMTKPTSFHGKVDPNARHATDNRDYAMEARVHASKTPSKGPNQGADQINPSGKPLNAAESKEYARMLKDDINAADHEFAGLQAARQADMTYVQVAAEMGKSLAQGTGAFIRAGYENEISKLEENRVYLENCKDLISSLLQQIQGRVSSASKGSLDGIDTLRNAIRQFQG